MLDLSKIILSVIENIQCDSLPAQIIDGEPKQLLNPFNFLNLSKKKLKMYGGLYQPNKLYDLIILDDHLDISKVISQCHNHAKIYFIGDADIKWFLSFGAYIVESKIIAGEKHYVFSVPRKLKKPIWAKEKCKVLIYSTCGQGDIFFKWRYVKKIPDFVFEARKSLATLLQANGANVFIKGNPLPDYDKHINIMHVEGDSDPIPYILAPDPSKFILQKPAIGVCWKGHHVKSIGPRRIFNPEYIKYLNIKPIYSLQKHTDIAESTNHLIDLGKQINNWADTANILANLDLFITVDTGIAHLAGAMGINTYLLAFPNYDIGYGTKEYSTIKVIKKDWNKKENWIELKRVLCF